MHDSDSPLVNLVVADSIGFYPEAAAHAASKATACDPGSGPTTIDD